MHFPIRLVRWLLAGALLGCLYLAGHGALLLYFTKGIGGVSVFRPNTAEAVSRDAAPFQLNTKETDGLFRIVQQQHSELNIMFGRLQTADELNWSLAFVGTAAASTLAFILSACLVLLARARDEPSAHSR